MESEFSYYLKKSRLWLNYTLQRASNSETEGTQLIEGQVNAVPEHTANTGIEYDLNDQWSLNTYIYHVSNTTAKTEGGAWIYLPSHTLLNTHMAYTLENLEYTLSIHNLGDRKYRVGGNTPPTPQQGRWFTAGVKWSF